MDERKSRGPRAELGRGGTARRRRPRPRQDNSPLAASPARLRSLFATLAPGLGAPVDAGICPRQVALQILGLGERRSCRHGSSESGATARRWGQNSETQNGRRRGGGARTGSGGLLLELRELTVSAFAGLSAPCIDSGSTLHPSEGATTFLLFVRPSAHSTDYAASAVVAVSLLPRP